MLHAFINEPQQPSGRPAWHEERDCRAEHGHAMAGHKPAAENQIVDASGEFMQVLTLILQTFCSVLRAFLDCIFSIAFELQFP